MLEETPPQSEIDLPTWEDDENRATLFLRAVFAVVAGALLLWTQWNAPAQWSGTLGQNWGRWVSTSVLLNFLLPLGIVWLFFAQTITREAMLKDQKHNAWSYGFGWFGYPDDVEWEQLPVLKWWRFQFLKFWHPIFRNPQFWKHDLKRHLKIALVCWLVFLPFLWFFSRDPSAQASYSSYLPPKTDAQSWAYLVGTHVLYMFCWEWFFRGFLLFGTAQGVGAIAAIGLQAAMFGLAHWGKPPIEFYSAFAGGIVLGIIAWREKSFVPAFLIHALIHVTWVILV